MDAVCFNGSPPPVVEMFAQQVLAADLNTKGSAEVVAAARLYVSAMDRTLPRRKSLMWNAPAGLPATQLFPRNIVLSLSNRFKDPCV